MTSKDAVRDYWEASACGDLYAVGATDAERFAALRRARYGLEPYLKPFADFASGRGRDVLEVGVGMGSDHTEWAAQGPRSLTGVDLTEAGVSFTRRHLECLGRRSALLVGDAEQLPFAEETFDVVYSWGVLHHSPDTPRAFSEVARVLRPGGEARLMIYHRLSLTGLMLLARYGWLRGDRTLSLDEVYAEHLESPGTKAYTISEAKLLCRDFSAVDVRVQLSHGDLLRGGVGRRHRGLWLSAARRLWPRRLLERFAQRFGLCLLITARK